MRVACIFFAEYSIFLIITVYYFPKNPHFSFLYILSINLYAFLIKFVNNLLISIELFNCRYKSTHKNRWDINCDSLNCVAFFTNVTAGTENITTSVYIDPYEPLLSPQSFFLPLHIINQTRFDGYIYKRLGQRSVFFESQQI